jgi:hypothetical protein
MPLLIVLYSMFTPQNFDWASIWDNRRADGGDEDDLAAIEGNKGELNSK